MGDIIGNALIARELRKKIEEGNKTLEKILKLLEEIRNQLKEK